MNAAPGGPAPARRRAAAAFTMVEIALAIGVIAFAMVAILGVLPVGVRVQKDNREDTIINQDGQLWLEAIRSGARGMDDLTNFVDWIAVTNQGSLPVTPRTIVANNGYLPSARTGLWLTNGETIIGLLSIPKYRINEASIADINQSRFLATSNFVTARVRAISGSATARDPSARDIAFSYLLTSEVIPYVGFLNNMSTSRESPGRPDSQMQENSYEVRVTLRWPVIETGTGSSRKVDVGGNRKVFRALLSGSLINHPTVVYPDWLLWFAQPNNFIQARNQ